MTEFWVPGKPVQQGSMNFYNGHAVHSKGKDLTNWREAIGWAAKGVGVRVSLEAIRLELRFVLPRPKTVTRPLPTVPPDLDKLARSCLDSLTGVAYKDDSQVVELIASKRYGDIPGVGITVRVAVDNPRHVQ